MALSDDDDMLDQWWEVEEEESDDDDYYIASVIIVDMEHERTKKKRPGSILGCRIVPRDRFGGNLHLVADYFADPPVYPKNYFRRRFRMKKELFLRIVAGVEAHDDYFKQRPNAVGLLGCTALQKVVGSFRMLAYGVPADSVDEIVRVAESTMIEAFQHFVKAVVEVYRDRYLRAPDAEDTARLVAMNTARGLEELPNCLERFILRAC